MIEYALALQLYQKPQDFNFQNAIQQALTATKVVEISETPTHPMLELRLVAQNVEGKHYTLDQVKGILSKPYPYSNSKANDFSDVIAGYDNLVKKSEIIKYALNKFPSKELKENSGLFYGYLWEIIDFEVYLTSLQVQSLVEGLKDISKALKEKSEVNAKSTKLQERIERERQVHNIFIDISSIHGEIINLMKARGLK